MAEQTFKSPNFYEREIDLSTPVTTSPTGVPGGIIGTAKKGPAFVPVTVADFNKFAEVFGGLDFEKMGPYAANEFLKNKTALTYLRVLGAGSNATSDDSTATKSYGIVKNAGFRLSGSAALDSKDVGCVQFIAAIHDQQSNESTFFPMLTDNDSIIDPDNSKLIRGVVLLASGARLQVNVAGGTYAGNDEAATNSDGNFTLAISSSWSGFGQGGIKTFNASLDPTRSDYFGKLLNIDPDRFVEEQHLLYMDFAVDAEVAEAKSSTVGILSGSSNVAQNGRFFREAFGSFDTRYSVPSTTMFISQPFGNVEYDLFKVEALDDGAYANSLYKISVTNIQASLNDADPFGTFTLQVRNFGDNDFVPEVIEQFNNCSLNPDSANYVARVVGDSKKYFNFDAYDATERRVVVSGKYPNNSKYVRVVMSNDVEKKLVPAKSLPFGFRGVKTLKTTNTFTDVSDASGERINLVGTSGLSGSIVPPVPFRVKVTRGSSDGGGAWLGQPGILENVTPALYWGVKFERNTNLLNPNTSVEPNPIVKSFTKFSGIEKLDVLVTGSGADLLNNNKFTLARVALAATSVAELTGSVDQQMKSAAYVRNGSPDPTTYKVDAGISGRMTFASLLTQLSASSFNQYSPYMKFSTFMAGGFDGINFLDEKARKFNDRSVSFEDGASTTYTPPGLVDNFAGSELENNAVASYVTAVNQMTDAMNVNINVLAIPGIKETYLTDLASGKVRDYGYAMYVMDIDSYDDDANIIYSDDPTLPNVYVTSDALDARAIDNNYVSTYFPDVFVFDSTSRRNVKVPASVAALGALGFNDKVSYPWFAPAGFNRASLDFVKNVSTRLNSNDRDRLYSSRINPIATFPRLGFVIYGQKTLQRDKSALDRVNVRRLLLEVKRIVAGIAQNIVFDQNTPAVRNKFVADSNAQLAIIQLQSGIEQFQVVMNETNNTQQDVDLNRLNGRIVIVPTRVVEFIAIDFIITNSGIQFV